MTTGVAGVGVVVAMSLSLLNNGARASECQREAEQAFGRLTTSDRSYRRETTKRSHQVRGERFEFVPPDRMRFAVNHAAGGFGAIRVGKRLWHGAWDDTKVMWDEARNGPPYEQALARSYTERTLTLSDLTFACLGPVEYSGKSFFGYRARCTQLGEVARLQTRPLPSQEPHTSAIEEPALWITIFVDPPTGMLAYEIVAEDDKLDDPQSLTRYTYVNDITIEPPRE